MGSVSDLDARHGMAPIFQPRFATDGWLTPPHILMALGQFDLDPCAAPEPRLWATAAAHWTREDNSLNRPWFGRVWLNPPYGASAKLRPWMNRMVEHNRGTALLFARTETTTFFDTVWRHATALLFLEGRQTFLRPDGSAASANAGAPHVLVAYGNADAGQLRMCDLAGQYVSLRGGQ